MFYAANWFIELINSFSTQQEEDINVMVMVRLKQVLNLQKTMAVVLSQQVQLPLLSCTCSSMASPAPGLCRVREGGVMLVLDGVECAGAQVYVLIDNKVGGLVVVGVTTTSPEEMEHVGL